MSVWRLGPVLGYAWRLWNGGGGSEMGMKLSPVLGRAWRLCNGGGGSQMGMVLEVRRWKWDFFACPLRPLRCRGGRITLAEGGCEHVTT
jgi:hypothetical protein